MPIGEMIETLLAVLFLMGAYLFAGRLDMSKSKYKSHWLSFAGGVSMGYVFMHLLPELSLFQAALPKVAVPEQVSIVLEFRVYVMALTGLITYYGMERMVVYFHNAEGEQEISKRSVAVFWVHIIGFALYNALIGYMVVNSRPAGLMPLLLICVVMGLHFLIIAHGLHREHQAHYSPKVQWLLAAAIAIGWLVGVVMHVPENIKIIVFSFLAGGLIVNTIKEEMPSAKESRFWSFLLGVLFLAIMAFGIYSYSHH